MFGAKFRVWGYGNKLTEFPLETAVRRLADEVHVSFSTEDCGKTLTAKTYANAPVVVAIYKDGEPVVDAGIDYRGDKFSAQRTKAFSTDAAMLAITTALGLELRAEYVVGDSTPHIVAVKKAKAK